MEDIKDLKIMATMSKPIIEKIDECFQQFENMLPCIEEIEFIEDYLLDANRLTLGENPSEAIIRNSQNFNITNTYYDISDSQQNTEKLASYHDNIEQLKNQLSTLDTEYDKMLEEKRLLEDKMSEFSTDRDTILAFKLGTLSHFCYDKKIKFGFFLKKKTMDFRTFPYNLNENLPEELECRWTVLKSFISDQP